MQSTLAITTLLYANVPLAGMERGGERKRVVEPPLVRRSQLRDHQAVTGAGVRWPDPQLPYPRLFLLVLGCIAHGKDQHS